MSTVGGFFPSLVSLRVIQRASVQTPLASFLVSTDFYPLKQTRCFCFFVFFATKRKKKKKKDVAVNLCKIAKILRGCVGVDVGSVTKEILASIQKSQDFQRIIIFFPISLEIFSLSSGSESR